MSMPTMTIPQGIRLSGRRMTVVTGALLFALLGYSIPSNMLVPLVTSLQAAYHISAVAAIWISLIALLSGASFVPTLCRYLVTFWSGFRGGDRAMVARPHMEAAVPAGVSGIPDAAGGAEAS
jgi:hypothetical protein